MVIELVEMTISTKYSGFDKLNHRFSYLLDSLTSGLHDREPFFTRIKDRLHPL